MKQETVASAGPYTSLLQTDNHASTPSLSLLQAGCPSCNPVNSISALNAQLVDCKLLLRIIANCR